MRYYLLILGVGLICFGLRLIYQRISFLLRSRKTYGTFVNLREEPKLNSTKIYYYAEVVFEASDGTEHRVTSDIGSGSYQTPKPQTDRQIPVRYDPRNPDDAHIDTLFNLWSPSLGFLLLGSAAIFAFLHPQH